MAITIVTTPQLFTPVYNDIAFVVNSSNKALCSMRYVARVTVRGTVAGVVKLFPNEVNGMATFRLNKMLENYVTATLHNNLAGVATNNESVISYSVEFGEETDGTSDCTGTDFTIVYSAETDPFYAWNGVLQYPEFPSYDYLNFMPRRNTSVPSANILYNPTFIQANGGWTAWNIDINNNAFGLLSGLLAGQCGTAPYNATATSLQTFLTAGVQYDFRFTIFTSEIASVRLRFGSASAFFDPVLAQGNHVITGSAVATTTGEISFLVTESLAGSIWLIDNMEIRESATTSNTWEPCRFLTNSGTVPIHAGEEAYLSWLQYADPTVNYQPNAILIRAYDADGVMYGTEQFIDMTTDTTIDPNFIEVDKLMITVGVGPKNLGEYLITLFGFDTIETYTVQLVNKIVTGPGPTDYTFETLSEIKTFDYVQSVTRFTTNRLMWLNRLGGLDNYSFRLRDNRSVSIDSSEYTKIIPYFTAGLNTFGYSLGDRGRRVIYNDVTEKFSVLSEYMTVEQAAWIEELFTTPLAYKQEIAKVICFNEVSNSPTLPPDLASEWPNAAEIFLQDGHGIVVGDQFLIQSNQPEDTLFTVIYVDGNSVYVNQQILTSGVMGYRLMVIGESRLLPIIITSKEFKNRDKKGSNRNISYTIEYEMAYPIVVQRG